MSKYVAAIDQGTTSTRCMLFDHGGNVVAVDQKEHKQIYPKPGWVEHDPLEIWEYTHLAHRRPMMGAFLDSLGIGHDNGLITEDDVKAPARQALLEAARALAAAWPAEDVRLYFTTLLLQDPGTWGALEDLAEGPSRGGDA